MRYKIQAFIIFFGLIVLLNACKSSKATVQPIQTQITLCDTIQTYINRNSEQFTPEITNIDPDKHTFTTKLGDIDCYQIEWNSLPVFTSYQLWFDDISFTYKLGTNECRLAGNKVVCFVDQLKLGAECRKHAYGDTTNNYDCIYSHRWNLMVRGVVCDDTFGPFSNDIRKVSFQCIKPDE